jgi:hydroxyacyl-ACP dehydratase HTD2-like protein with hotdog domain
MWAGGSLMFCPNGLGLNLNAKRYCCVEKITDVSVKGTEGKERVFVTIERRTSRAYDPSLPPDSRAAVLETRNLVFMREKTPEAAKEDAARRDKILKRENLTPH